MADETKRLPEREARFECEKCRRTFRDGYNLRQHQNRKRPCAPVLDAEDLPTQERENPNRCRFCGRTFSRIDALKRHQRQNCRILREEGGMEVLYNHVLKRSQAPSRQEQEKLQDRIEELEAERAADQRRLNELEARLAAIPPSDRALDGGAAAVNIDNSVHLTDRRTVFNSVNIIVNMFGKEDTAHISAEKVRRILVDAAAGVDPGAAKLQGHTLRASAIKAVCEAALLIYSDPEHPENITCYIPNKRDGTALVHGEQGWEIQPVPLVLPPMTQNSVDLLFDNQPFEDDSKQFEAILAHIRDSERELSSAGSSCEAHMRAVLIRNKDLLARVLKALPVAGDE